VPGKQVNTGIDYYTEARRILNAMWSKNGTEGIMNVINVEHKQITFVPDKFGYDWTDPSYHLPAFYEVWAEYAKDKKWQQDYSRRIQNSLFCRGIDILCMSCEEQQKSGWFAFVTEIRNRHFPIVDEERGLVLSFGFFDHDAAVRRYPLPDGTMTPNVATYPQTIEISELFQIRNDKIDQIEAVINTVPYGISSEVWDK
jgi:hypothetical protein